MARLGLALAAAALALLTLLSARPALACSCASGGYVVQAWEEHPPDAPFIILSPNPELTLFEDEHGNALELSAVRILRGLGVCNRPTAILRPVKPLLSDRSYVLRPGFAVSGGTMYRGEDAVRLQIGEHEDRAPRRPLHDLGDAGAPRSLRILVCYLRRSGVQRPHHLELRADTGRGR
jgi:hypothetical protein